MLGYMEMITYDECISIIQEFRFWENSSLFALERNKGLESILRNIYQSYLFSFIL